MKVLFTTSSFPKYKNDSHGAFVLSLAEHLGEIGHDIHVLAPHAKSLPSYEVIDGISVHRYKYFLPSSMQRLCYGGGIMPNIRASLLAKLQVPFFLIAQQFALYKFVRKNPDLDIIHAHWLIPQGFIAASSFIRKNIPLVVSAHGTDVFIFSKKYYGKKLLSHILRNASGVTVNSSATQAVVSKFSNKSSIIPMGIDTAKYYNSPRGLDLRKELSVDGPLILFVGRLIEVKGVSYLISSMVSVLAVHLNAKLVIVGDGPERDTLKEQAESLGILHSIVFYGRCDREKMPDVFASCDIFVGPSIIADDGSTEALGVVFLEALASGKAVIGTRTGGIVDIIKNDVNGLLVEEKNSIELSDAILRILSDDNLREQLEATAREHVSGSYEWNHIADAFSTTYVATRRTHKLKEAGK